MSMTIRDRIGVRVLLWGLHLMSPAFRDKASHNVRVARPMTFAELVDTTVATGREANTDVVLSYLSRLRSMTDSPRLLADIAEVEAERLRELAQRSGAD